ncbi:MAG: LbtU family siderophore porin [Gammaproteobacteria bacterium]|nr:LbtU family siderophore porin [Gammaproteobacteria bacterium]
MKLKAIAIALSMATVSFAHADMNSQLSSLQAQVNQLQSQVSSMGSTSGSSMSGVVGLNSNLSMQMMDNQSGVGKELNLLTARQNGMNQMLTLGGYAEGDAVYDHSNQNNDFINPAIQSAALTSNASNATRLMLTDASLSTTANLGSWVTAYMQLGQSNIGEGSDVTTGFGVQDAYLVFGNLAQMPVYGFAGNKEIDFGSFSSVDIYNQPLTRTLFQAHGNTAGVGVNAYGFNGVVSVMNGGQQTSAVSVGSNYQAQNLNTSNSSQINNFAVNLTYGMTNGAISWDVGAGYLNGSSLFNNTTNASHANGQTNGAWDLNGKVSAYGFDLLGEYVTTVSNTYASTHAFGGTSAKSASAWDVGADYNFPVMGYKSVVNADYSGASLANGDNGKGSQYVVGYRVEAVNNVWAGIEYAYTKGLANYLGASSGALDAGSAPTLTNSSNFNNVKNSTVSLDITAAF